MFDPKVHVGVAALLFNPADGNELLVIQRSDTVSHGAGKWSVPGGWIDEGETPQDAIAREVKEEVGIEFDPELAHLYHAVHNAYDDPINSVICLFYFIDLDQPVDPKIMEPDKMTALLWKRADKVPDLDLFAPMRTLVDTYGI